MTAFESAEGFGGVLGGGVGWVVECWVEEWAGWWSAGWRSGLSAELRFVWILFHVPPRVFSEEMNEGDWEEKASENCSGVYSEAANESGLTSGGVFGGNGSFSGNDSQV